MREVFEDLLGTLRCAVLGDSPYRAIGPPASLRYSGGEGFERGQKRELLSPQHHSTKNPICRRVGVPVIRLIFIPAPGPRGAKKRVIGLPASLMGSTML